MQGNFLTHGEGMLRITLLAVCIQMVFFCGWSSSCFAVVAAGVRYYATRNSIGIEWDISADSNHNAQCQVQYRKRGNSIWQEGMPLFRVDFNGADMLAGSILFLEPSTTYDVQLLLTDTDGGNESKAFSLQTLSLPVLPQNGRTLYVTPGSGGGNGSKNDPFKGLETAQNHVLPGDIVLIGAGYYDGEIEFTVSGEPDNYIVWKAMGNGAAVLQTIRVNGDHLWLEGLQIKGDSYGVRTYNNPVDVVVRNNRFTGCHYCIYLNHGGNAWYITDNTIVGDVSPASGDFSGEGVELNHSSNHTVRNNSISRVADGVSYPGSNCDIFANEIFDVSDDGIEPDYGYANNRVYHNRISNAFHNGISFQPMNGAPWYILRNQVAAPVESALKFRNGVDRALIAHNTFIGWRGAQKSGSSFLVAVQSNNNLWISMTDYYAWENGSGGEADWRTNLDYDGFDWGDNIYAVKWGERYQSLGEFYQATGLEEHAIRIDKATCFTAIDIPRSPPASMKEQYLTLRSECNAVDKGVVLPNINDNYAGTGPDLGAYEVGAALPHYGPRTVKPPPPPDPPPEDAVVAPVLGPLLLD